MVEKRKREDDIITKNPKVDKDLVFIHRKLLDNLQKAGIDIKPEYSISPPLGGSVPSLLTYGKT